MKVTTTRLINESFSTKMDYEPSLEWLLVHRTVGEPTRSTQQVNTDRQQDDSVDVSVKKATNLRSTPPTTALSDDAPATNKIRIILVARAWLRFTALL